MNADAFEAQLKRTLEAIASLPAETQATLLARVEETRQRHAEITRDVALARDALDDWRIVQKYLVFDAEASAREAAHH